MGYLRTGILMAAMTALFLGIGALLGGMGGALFALIVAWSAPIGWSDLIVSALWAFDPAERCFRARVGDSPMRCAA